MFAALLEHSSMYDNPVHKYIVHTLWKSAVSVQGQV